MVKFHVCLGISQTSATLGNPVRGYPLVVHSKSLRELMRHPNVNKWVNSPVLLIFHQFHRHILKNQTVLFPTTFISTSEKIGVGLKKQVAILYFSFNRRWGSPVFLSWLLFQCNMMVFSAIWPMKYLFNISDKMRCNLTSTLKYIRCKISQAFVPGTDIFVPNMTYEADDPVRRHYPLWGQERQLSGVWLQGLSITYGNICHYQSEIEIKKIAACFFKPTPIFSDAEMKVGGNSFVRFFKICLLNLLKINKSGEFIRLLTFRCLVSHGWEFA